MIKNKRGDLEFSFAWIFAIIAGMFILFLAIYGVTKFMSIERASQDAQTAMDIGILINPLESSFDSAKRTMIGTPVETRIYLGCEENNYLGEQTIKVSQKTYNEWSEEGTTVSFKNKYIFSNNPVEGKNFYLFSKPFDFPFKVSDLTYLTSTKDKYCFKNAPRDIEEEIEKLTGNNLSGNENFFTKDCPSNSINVCFGFGSDCDIKVDMGLKSVEKDNKRMFYEGDALMYAAIFSNKEEYECQVSRLMKRVSQLSDLYRDKSIFVFQRTGCNSGLDSQLVQLKSMAENLDGSEGINSVYTLAEQINVGNNYNSGDCKLW